MRSQITWYESLFIGKRYKDWDLHGKKKNDEYIYIYIGTYNARNKQTKIKYQYNTCELR